ncbi:uncharacterized protein MYCFIDRAFT_197026 [Pseudocercospora fijiensis CIRAD86]|uniref:Uncharacterized protein n=1 Tax=Pseudocercospora fijiensis (strain CIRAD86) TaxID=383855 RepID=M2ZRN4_PSEFD|nr:uncharacterized protein MYCFIDRAFT_197026 [Pseudocercospora fijiensis CIRAD86]EME81699.1 hypothetical protein MYCFIDRAFT_197026 [Pseudocercospora fijiensis CIRAD86]
MGLLAKITSKFEARVLHRDVSHANRKELPPKDDRPRIDYPAPTPSPAEGIHAKDFAHRQDFRRSQSARHSDIRHELPVPDDSEARVGGQQRYYAREQQQQRRRGSTRHEQRPDQLHESAEPHRGESAEAERPAHITQTYHGQGTDWYTSVDHLVDPGQHSHHLCFHSPQDARANTGVEAQDEPASILPADDTDLTTVVTMGARTTRERHNWPIKIGSANIKHIHRKISDRERKEGEVRSERDIHEQSDQERSELESQNQVVQAPNLEHDNATSQPDGMKTYNDAESGHANGSLEREVQIYLDQHYHGARRDLEKIAVAGI